MSRKHINKPPHTRSPIITKSHLQASTFATHLVEGQSPIPTTPVSERPTENISTPAGSGVITSEQWRKNTNDIAARVEELRPFVVSKYIYLLLF